MAPSLAGTLDGDGAHLFGAPLSCAQVRCVWPHHVDPGQLAGQCVHKLDRAGGNELVDHPREAAREEAFEGIRSVPADGAQVEERGVSGGQLWETMARCDVAEVKPITVARQYCRDSR